MFLAVLLFTVYRICKTYHVYMLCYMLCFKFGVYGKLIKLLKNVNLRNGLGQADIEMLWQSDIKRGKLIVLFHIDVHFRATRTAVIIVNTRTLEWCCLWCCCIIECPGLLTPPKPCNISYLVTLTKGMMNVCIVFVFPHGPMLNRQLVQGEFCFLPEA